MARRRAVRFMPLIAAVLLVLPLVGNAAAHEERDVTTPDAVAGQGGWTGYEFTGDHGMVRNILPPGSRGNVDAAELAKLGVENLPDLVASPQDPQGALTTANAAAPKHYADWLGPYDKLNTIPPRRMERRDLLRNFKDESLHPETVVSRTRLRGGGLVIKRDKKGVPFVYGESRTDVAFGAGYAGIKDRMFLTDVLRHAGAARMSEFLGASRANVAMDRSQLRAAAYTEAEAAAQVRKVAQRAERVAERFPKVDRRFGDISSAVLSWVDAYVAGMNAAQRQLCPAAFGLSILPGSSVENGFGLGANCPVEYALLQKEPQPYDRADIVYIASLVGGIFGKGGGGEFANGVWLRQLAEKYGMDVARQIYDDLRSKNDPEAPTTATKPFSYGGSDEVNPDRPGVALPDPGGPIAPGTGSMAGDGGLPFGVPSVLEPGGSSLRPKAVDGPLGPIPLGLNSSGMSNALLVDAEHSANGHPTAVFGPQTGYYAPQLLTEIAMHGPGIHARGVSFAGTQLAIQLGRGVDYAWSATSATGDNVDTVMERLCEPDGSRPTVESTHYLNADGQCVPLKRYVHTETAVPTAGGTAAPEQLEFLVLRTRHGIVQLRTTVQGQPVAVVIQRSTYGHELDSALGFMLFNAPFFVQDAEDFMAAASVIDYTFNWFYVDDTDIAYFNSGLLPIRAGSVDTDLPRWGSPNYDWQGFLPFQRHPHQVNPPTGYLVSWNNKAAPRHASADNEWGEGPVYRSLALSDRIGRLLRQEGGVTPAALVGAMMGAATVDVRARYLLPELLRVIGEPADPQLRAAADLLRAWLNDGAHRVDRDRDGDYSHEAAIALFDEWWASQTTDPAGNFAVGKAVLRGTLGDLVEQLPKALDNHPRSGLGSAWNGVAWYGYVDKNMRQVLGEEVEGAYSRTYCGGGSLSQCRQDLRGSLSGAIGRILTAKGVSRVSALTYDKNIDDIWHVTAGVVGVRPIDWQNRPTFQQVVSFTSGRGS